MKNMVCKFSKPEQKILDAFLGFCKAYKAGVMVEKHYIFFGCKQNVRCVEKSVPSFVETHAFQQLKQATDLAGDE